MRSLIVTNGIFALAGVATCMSPIMEHNSPNRTKWMEGSGGGPMMGEDHTSMMTDIRNDNIFYDHVDRDQTLEGYMTLMKVEDDSSGAQSKVADGGACMNGPDCASYTCDQQSKKYQGKGECVKSSKVADGGACVNGPDCASGTCNQKSNKHSGKGECVKPPPPPPPVADGGACMKGPDCASGTCNQMSNKHTGKGECVAGKGGRRSLQSNDDDDDDDKHTGISEIEKLPHLIDGGGLEIDEKSVLELKAGALQLNGRLVSNGDVVIGDEAEIYISKELYHLQRTTTDSNHSDSVTAKIVLDVYPEKHYVGQPNDPTLELP